jgi:hypothetical protein
MSLTLNLKADVEAGLLSRADEAGVSLERYLEAILERAALPAYGDSGNSTESGMVWEDGLLIYGAGFGNKLPAGFLNSALQRSREERSRHLLEALS